ncbi:MAG: hypothetical protein ACRD1H_15360, partial [Vicinamibacterales bacterium]
MTNGTLAWRWRIARVVRLSGIGVMAGMAAGFVAGGLGSRLAMRIVALTAGRGHYGELTEAEAAVGQMTLGGTLFLLIFAAVIGVAGGVAWMALRRWFWPAGRWRGIAYGGLLLATTGFTLLD